MCAENGQLRRELDLLKQEVIWMDRKMLHIDDEKSIIRSRSMSDNI